MSRSKRRQNNLRVQGRVKASPTRVEQIKEVQGPQLYNRDPIVAPVELEADLREKYLGTALTTFGASLRVLTNNSNAFVQKYGYGIFSQMLLDPEIDASFDALVVASTAQPVTVSSPVTDPSDPFYEQAAAIAEFVQDNILELPIDTWRREQLRTALTYGQAVSEIDWKIENDALVINRLRVQNPETYGFVVDQWGEVYGVAPLNQATSFYMQGNYINLQPDQLHELRGIVPRFKISLWTWEMQGTDPRGKSMLLPVYIPWWSKQRAIEEWSCWLGRYAQPSIWGTPGPNAVATCDPVTGAVTQPTELLLAALQKFRSGSALALPHGSNVAILQADGDATPFIESMEFFNKEITRSLLGQHLATSSEGGSQSKSAADSHANVLRQLIGSIRQFQERMIYQEIVKPLVQVNFGFLPRKYMPVVSVGDSDGFPPSVTEIAVLFQAGYFTEDQLPVLDKLLGMPVRKTTDRVGAGNLPQPEQNQEPQSSSADTQPPEEDNEDSEENNDTDK